MYFSLNNTYKMYEHERVSLGALGILVCVHLCTHVCVCVFVCMHATLSKFVYTCVSVHVMFKSI